MSVDAYTLGKKVVPVATLQRAMEAHAAGRLSDAEFCCRLILGADKKQFDALHLLGMIEFQRGRFSAAHDLIRQAVKINSRSVSARSNLALVLQQLDRPEEALLALNKALSMEPDNLLALNNKGHVLWRLKRSEEALVSLDRALSIKPDYVDALCNRGNALVDLRRLDEALLAYDQALALNPQDAPTYTNRGNVLWGLNRRDEALQSYDQALALNPNDLSTLVDRGTALLHARQGVEALACFERALAIKPGDPYLAFKRGSALIACDRYEEALDCFDQAFAIAPPNADALEGRANALVALQRHAEAITNYDQALAIAPESPRVHWNRALALLRAGDFDRGWKEYEWRWKVDYLSLQPRDFPAQLLWLGERSLEGKTILLHAEQGLGDTIQFVRYVPVIAGMGANVILEVQPPLKTLLSGLDGAGMVIAKGEELPPFDLHCPLLSLPLACKTRLETIPSSAAYLSASAERVAYWASQLPKSEMPRVGVVWGGNPDFYNDRARSIGLANFAPLLSLPGVQFFGLQKDLRAGDHDIMRGHPRLIHLGDRLTDFRETAAIMSQLDLVVSSDTSAAHLAGALGRPVWVLLDHANDWRWMHDREENPWYETARLFRQPRVGDWESVVRRVAGELAVLRPA